MTSDDKPIQRLVRSLLVLVAVCVLGLIAGVVLVSVQAAETGRRLTVLEEYVQGRGEYRDAEAKRMERQGAESLRRAMCDLLDQLPEGGLLERPRSKYGCGPGIPLSELPPEQQERLRGQRTAPSSQPVAPAPRSAPTPLAEGANPSGPVLTPEPTPEPASPPSTASEPPPLVDLGPYTGPLCESVRVCF